MPVNGDTYWGGRYRLNAYALLALRRMRGKTQILLAAETGVHDSFISRLERGQRLGCTPEMVEKLAVALDVPASALLAVSQEEHHDI